MRLLNDVRSIVITIFSSCMAAALLMVAYAALSATRKADRAIGQGSASTASQKATLDRYTNQLGG